MALRGALTHRKTRWLAESLNIKLPYALGLMEALWHLTAEQTPTGAIGKLSDKAIAAEMYWDDDPAILIDALVKAEILDVDAKHRLIVHGWAERADQATKRKLTRHKQTFAGHIAPETGQLPSVSSDSLDTNRLPEPEPETRARASTPQPPSPGGECDDSSPNGHSPPPSRPPDPWFQAFEQTYLKRVVRSDEWITVRQQLDAWVAQGYPIKRRWFEECCVEARADTKERTGKFPFTITPLIDLMTERIGELAVST